MESDRAICILRSATFMGVSREGRDYVIAAIRERDELRVQLKAAEEYQVLLVSTNGRLTHELQMERERNREWERVWDEAINDVWGGDGPHKWSVCMTRPPDGQPRYAGDAAEAIQIWLKTLDPRNKPAAREPYGAEWGGWF